MASSGDPGLLEELNARVGGPKCGRALKKECSVWGIPDLQITRWKFNEWDYYSPKARLPVAARGLFTLGDRILVRGYNKFFNTNEVAATKAARLQDETRGPYYATVKENGYLVLIGAQNNRLVVTSKNSSGPDSTNDAGRNYSEVARSWVFRHLAAAGRTEEEFACFLQENDWTAVGEVCDDSFEEHVLPYPPEIAGIYLNGLNHNTREFATEPPARVLEAATRFGFRRTEFVEFDGFEALMAFLEDGAKTGKWQNREVEGFVIRCKRVVPAAKPAAKIDGEPNGERDGQPGTDARLEDFFWKFKFEEPYLMFREWREVVKTYLGDGSSAAYARARRSRHAASCLRFLPFAAFYLEQHPELKERLAKHNLGIIELRSKFFEAPEVSEEALLALDAARTPRWLLVTVATLGCGKSTVASTLCRLLGAECSHVQNDTVSARPGKGGKMAQFMSAIDRALVTASAVVVDKNHSGKDERAKLLDSCEELSAAVGYDTKYVCLNFLPDGPSKQTAALTRERVAARGDNHPTVKASQLGAKGVNGIMAQFERRFDRVTPQLSPDDRFDLVVDLVPGDSAENVRRVLNALRTRYPDSPLAAREFSEAEVVAAVQAERDEEALQAALAAEATAKAPPLKNKKPSKPSKLNKLSYFGVGVAPADYAMLVAKAKGILGAEDAPALATLRIQPRLHVTLAHRQSHAEHFEALKTQHAAMLAQHGLGPLGERRELAVLGLAWNERVAAFKVQIDGSANAQAHATLATAAGVAPVEANDLFKGDDSVHYVAFEEPLVLKDQELFAAA